MPNDRMLPDAKRIFDRLEATDATQRELAAYIGIDENKLSKIKSGVRQFKGTEILKAMEWLDRLEQREGYREVSDVPHVEPTNDYVPIEVLPTYGGMGGGGVIHGEDKAADRATRPRPTTYELSYAVLQPAQIALAVSDRPGSAILVLSVGRLNFGFEIELAALTDLIARHASGTGRDPKGQKPN